MKPQNSLIIYVIVLLALSGCAMTYEAPTTSSDPIVVEFNSSKDEIFTATTQALVSLGYQISTRDLDSGVISTDRRQMNLSESDCDCGKTLGIPYIKDKRTITYTTIGIIIKDRQLSIIVNIDGEYLKGHTTQGIDLYCKSRGTIENSIIRAVRKAIQDN